MSLKFVLTGKMFLCSLIFGIMTFCFAQQPAFPTAEGFGRYARGGRDGDVYHVTKLHDKGPGYLRYGIISANGPRAIVFDTSGTIVLQSPLEVDKPNIIIAGQTAPGDLTPDLVVAQDGSGDYTTIGEALEEMPEDNDTLFVIYVKNGLYTRPRSRTRAGTGKLSGDVLIQNPSKGVLL